MATKVVSKYFEQLNEKAQQRYEDKLHVLGGIEDPYLGGKWLTHASSVE